MSVLVDVSVAVIVVAATSRGREPGAYRNSGPHVLYGYLLLLDSLGPMVTHLRVNDFCISA